jgi:hypothetical protein
MSGRIQTRASLDVTGNTNKVGVRKKLKGLTVKAA